MDRKSESNMFGPGQDTATGTDPDAKYDLPGYEDKSLGRAVNQDEQLVDELLDETGGDVEQAERRFAQQSTGSPAIPPTRDRLMGRSLE
jgi:hypothetical protein